MRYVEPEAIYQDSNVQDSVLLVCTYRPVLGVTIPSVQKYSDHSSLFHIFRMMLVFLERRYDLSLTSFLIEDVR